MVVVYPKSHAIANAAKVTAATLAEYPLILMYQGTSVRAVTDAAFRKAGAAPNPASEATYMMTAIGMVKAGIGLAILPISAREIAAERTLRSRRINDANFSRPVSLIKKANRTLPPIAQAFSHFLSDNLKTALINPLSKSA